MAELVDALVSNTNEAIRTGSSPVRGTRKGSEIIHFLFRLISLTTISRVYYLGERTFYHHLSEASLSYPIPSPHINFRCLLIYFSFISSYQVSALARISLNIDE